MVFFVQASDVLRDSLASGVKWCVRPASAKAGTWTNEVTAISRAANAVCVLMSLLYGAPRILLLSRRKVVVNDAKFSQIGRASCRESVNVGGGAVRSKRRSGS